ncbi:hypothetical protein QWZ03_05135 [Chitinimonas viridis]|uniref:DUF2007 domain-containing protein n=1 Tax=Chitinimonas viridis TaxID=664880 RepID=A0ABT8B3U6_9NEIS|nr:hypothetical protein [Chitinimonas viridis]MDN3576149.1 hypothetical protein [Chitinimonas viridis]
MTFIHLKVRAAMLVHGYDSQQQEIVEHAAATEFAEKLIRIERIQSITERYLLVTGAFGRMMYWEYAEDFATVKQRLDAAGLLLDAD